MSSLKIGTHNGTFHCDEALAVFLLRQTPKYKNADLIRTRDPALLDKCDIVVDVGAEYDATRFRFDHHQRGFTDVFGHGFQTKLSSAGLIYKHFGEEIISQALGVSKDDPKVRTLYLKLYREYIEAIDGIDNGVNQYPNDLTPKYRVRTDISTRVGWLNPAWNEPTESSAVDARFQKASTLVGEEFLGRLQYYNNAWLPARELVSIGLSNRFKDDPSGKIMVFKRFGPFKEHLYDLEREQSLAENDLPLYVLYPDETGGNWRVQAVAISPESFVSRKPLPEAWRGLRDEELSKKSGIPGCVFVHASGFTGGNKTFDGVLQMARAALSL